METKNKFQGRWVREIANICSKQGCGADAWTSIEEILDRADVLLQIAAMEVENEFLHDDIMKLLLGEENESGKKV